MARREWEVVLARTLSAGIWSELDASPVEVDLYRRNLQRAHVDVLASKLGEKPSTTSDLPALARGELTDLLDRLTRSLTGQVEKTTRLHLADVQARIRETLNPLLEREPGVFPALSASAPARSGE